MKLKLRRKRRNKIVIIYANKDQISKHCHGHEFFWLNLMNRRSQQMATVVLIEQFNIYLPPVLFVKDQPMVKNSQVLICLQPF